MQVGKSVLTTLNCKAYDTCLKQYQWLEHGQQNTHDGVKRNNQK